jgi:hypothetical protein
MEDEGLLPAAQRLVALRAAYERPHLYAFALAVLGATGLAQLLPLWLGSMAPAWSGAWWGFAWMLAGLSIVVPWIDRRSILKGDLVGLRRHFRWGSLVQGTWALWLAWICPLPVGIISLIFLVMTLHQDAPVFGVSYLRPFYLLLIADPAVVPYEVQYLLDVQGAVGRLWFGAVEPYAAYARSVVEAEGRATSAEALGVGLFGVRNADDPATQLSAQHLIAGLQQHLGARPEDPVRASLIGPEATKSALHSLLHGGAAPGLIFTASHGMGFPSGHALQRRHQGALLCQDWPGPRLWKEPIPTDHYLSADDIAEDADLCGRVLFSFACYGAGTPQKDDFFRRARDPVRADIAPAAFQAELPLRLLGRDKGALAFIGHVERAWGYSFLWRGVGRANGGVGDALITTFTSTVDALLAGKPVGVAMDVFNLKYAQFATWLTAELEEIDFGRTVDPAALVELWTCHNDARDTVIIGDPAVCLGGVAAGSATPRLVEASTENLRISLPVITPPAVAPPAFSAPTGLPAGRVVRTWVAPDLHRVEEGEALPAGARLVAWSRIGEDGVAGESHQGSRKAGGVRASRVMEWTRTTPDAPPSGM